MQGGMLRGVGGSHHASAQNRPHHGESHHRPHSHGHSAHPHQNEYSKEVEAQLAQDDDDNAAPEMQSEGEVDVSEKEDPLLLAIDDLEGRVVSALDDVKLHPGIRSSSVPGAPTVHEELATLLRPVLEVAAHTGPSVARTYYHAGAGIAEGIEASCEDVYQRCVSDLILPVMLEMAQSDTIPAKRCASLEFFRHLFKECHKAGSWLDTTTTGPQAGPYGSGSSTGSAASEAAQQTTANSMNATPAMRAQQKRRQIKRLAREGEILRYWIQASIACTRPGVFTSETSEGTVASRGIIAASASLRPSLKHIAQKIKDADDRGANRLFGPVMEMLEGVLKKLFLTTSNNDDYEQLSSSSGNEAMRSACIKFLEIVVLCCSRKPQESSIAGRRRPTSGGGGQSHGHSQDFSLEELPAGHPIITREALESIAEYAFTTLRGLAMMGGQVKIDINLLSDMMLSTGDTDNTHDPTSAAQQVLSILKPAALAYLEIESSSVAKDDDDDDDDANNESDKNNDDDDKKEKINNEKEKETKKIKKMLQFNCDPNNVEYDFMLSQKSYSLTLNAISALAVNRPTFYNEAVITLARRSISPPTTVVQGMLQLTISNHLRASCLTLLRNSLSVAIKDTWRYLHYALKVGYDMGIQADKALAMSRQANALKTAGRAARNRANMYYEWDAGTGDSETTDIEQKTKRQKETYDELQKMRAAKIARGLGYGIQLPTNMADSVELILLNLSHLPNKKPTSAATTKGGSTKKKKPVTLDFVIDAIMTNGASLIQEEGRWYDRDGGNAWNIHNLDNASTTTSDDDKKNNKYELAAKFLDNILMAPTSSTSSMPATTDATIPSSSATAETDAAIKKRKRDTSAAADDSSSRKKQKDVTSSQQHVQQENQEKKVFNEQCNRAASDAVGRIVFNSLVTNRSKSHADFGNQIAARLAFTLKGIQPPVQLQSSYAMAKESIASNSAIINKDRKTIKSEDENDDDDVNKLKNEVAEGIRNDENDNDDNQIRNIEKFLETYPLVSSCLALDSTSNVDTVSSLATAAAATAANSNTVALSSTTASAAGPGSETSDNTLTIRILNEAYAQSFLNDNIQGDDFEEGNNSKSASSLYSRSLDIFVASVVHAGKLSNDRLNDTEKRRVASRSASLLQQNLEMLPIVTNSSLSLVSAICDIEEISKKAAEAARKQSQQTIAASAAAHAAKTAAEKRATAALLMLRDVAFQRSAAASRQSAVNCAVQVATGHYPSNSSIEEKAVRLVTNVLFARSESLAQYVIDAATNELERAARYAIENYYAIEHANKKIAAGSGSANLAEKDPENHIAAALKNSLSSPNMSMFLLSYSFPSESNASSVLASSATAMLDGAGCDIERQVMEKVRKPALLFMALCLRRPEIIKTLFSVSCRNPKAIVLCKAIRANMSKLARAAATKHGAADIALRVAGMSSINETMLVLAFLDNLVPADHKTLPGQDIIDACYEIQETYMKKQREQKQSNDPDAVDDVDNNSIQKDPRFIIPIVSAIKRHELVSKLPEFVQADDRIFMVAFVRMGDRTTRHALIFRDEPDNEIPTLRGMTLCEQLVYLHRLDFAKAGLPQKRYLDAIRLCLDNDEIYNDRVIMSALDHMSGTFLTGTEKLPLAYMRTIILVCSKHESLHAWICHELLPRLVQGRIYTDRRQWEGWMRCAKMLENTDESGGASSLEAIRSLPAEQLRLYRSRYGEPGRG